MQIKLQLRRDTASPDLAKKIAMASAPHRAMLAGGTAVIALTKRAFRDPSARPASWASLLAATLKRKGKSNQPLINKGTLAHSPRVIRVGASTVDVGSDRPYAKYHQLGKGRMYRPFFPVDRNGKLSPLGAKNFKMAILKVLFK